MSSNIIYTCSYNGDIDKLETSVDAVCVTDMYIHMFFQLYTGTPSAGRSLIPVYVTT